MIELCRHRRFGCADGVAAMHHRDRKQDTFNGTPSLQNVLSQVEIRRKVYASLDTENNLRRYAFKIGIVVEREWMRNIFHFGYIDYGLHGLRMSG